MAITLIVHQLDTFDLENLGIKAADIAAGAITSGKIGAQGVRSTDLEYGLYARKDYHAVAILSDGDVVYVESASGMLECARTSISGQMPAIGVVDAAVAANAMGYVKNFGPHHAANYNFSGFVGRAAYVSNTSGRIDTSQGVTSGQYQQLGYIIDGSGIAISLGPVLAA